MRAIIVLVIITALAAAAFAIGLFDTDPGDLPTSDDTPLAAEKTEPRFDPLRTGLRVPEAKPTLPPTPTPPSNPEEPVKSTSDGTVLVLDVFDRTTGSAIGGFNYVLIDSDRPRIDEQVAESHFELVLEHNRDLELTIEALGYTPQSHKLRFAVGEQKRLLTIQLEPVARAAGVTLFVFDNHGQPVTDLVLEAQHRSIDSTQTDDFRRLWIRQSHNVDGKYPTPDLASGHYRFTLQAMQSTDPKNPTAQLEQRLLLPVTEELTFYGSEALEPRVDLRAGGQVDLEVFGLGGEALGQDVSLRLRKGDEEISIAWHATVDGRILEADGILPAATKCTLAHPIEPGTYILDLRRGQGAIVTRTLIITAGTRLPVRVDSLH